MKSPADQVVGRAIEVAQGFAAQLDARAYASTVRALRGDAQPMDAAVALSVQLSVSDRA